jgi:hypothetical protein
MNLNFKFTLFVSSVTALLLADAGPLPSVINVGCLCILLKNPDCAGFFLFRMEQGSGILFLFYQHNFNTSSTNNGGMAGIKVTSAGKYLLSPIIVACHWLMEGAIRLLLKLR